MDGGGTRWLIELYCAIVLSTNSVNYCAPILWRRRRHISNILCIDKLRITVVTGFVDWKVLTRNLWWSANAAGTTTTASPSKCDNHHFSLGFIAPRVSVPVLYRNTTNLQIFWNNLWIGELVVVHIVAFVCAASWPISGTLGQTYNRPHNSTPAAEPQSVSDNKVGAPIFY